MTSGLKKILIVNWQDIKNPLSGGAEIHLHEVGKRLVQNGVQCVLYCHRPKDMSAHEVIDGIEIYRQGSRLLFNWVVWFQVRKWVRQHRPDVVVDDTNKIPFFLSLLVSVPVVVRVHHLLDKTLFLETGFLQASYVYLLERLAPLFWRKAPVITVSPSTESELRSRGVQNISLCYNGTDAKAPADIPKVPWLVGYVGRIKRYKNLEVLLRIIKNSVEEFPEIRLQIGGTGDDVPRLKNLIMEYQIENFVEFKGSLSDQEKANFYASCSVMVNPSSKEGWGLTTIEANACGTVVVAFDVPGLRDSIENGETGWLVPFGDEAALQKAITMLLVRSEQREVMEAKARSWAEGFTWDKCYQSTLAVLEKTALDQFDSSSVGFKNKSEPTHNV